MLAASYQTTPQLIQAVFEQWQSDVHRHTDIVINKNKAKRTLLEKENEAALTDWENKNEDERRATRRPVEKIFKLPTKELFFREVLMSSGCLTAEQALQWLTDENERFVEQVHYYLYKLDMHPYLGYVRIENTRYLELTRVLRGSRDPNHLHL